jgi:hypothetical protein
MQCTFSRVRHLGYENYRNVGDVTTSSKLKHGTVSTAEMFLNSDENYLLLTVSGEHLQLWFHRHLWPTLLRRTGDTDPEVDGIKATLISGK